MKESNCKRRTIPESQLVCYCSQVTKGAVIEAIRNGASSVQVLQEATGAGVGGNCKKLNPSGKCCHTDLRVLLQEYGG